MGKSAAISRAPIKPINFLTRGLVGSVDIQHWTTLYLQSSKYTFIQAFYSNVHNNVMSIFSTLMELKH